MYSYQFERYTVDNPKLNFDNLMLWIIHSNKTPPHVGISKEYKFYSLKATGRDYGLSTNDTLALLKRKKIEVITIELKNKVRLEDIEDVFSHFSQAIPTKISCITPILQCLNMDEPILLYDLLKYLSSHNLISEVSVYNFQRETLALGIYDDKDVALEIEKLQGDKRK